MFLFTMENSRDCFLDKPLPYRYGKRYFPRVHGFRLKSCNTRAVKKVVVTEKCMMEVYGAHLPHPCACTANDIQVSFDIFVA
jgi:hypothetical protein